VNLVDEEGNKCQVDLNSENSLIEDGDAPEHYRPLLVRPTSRDNYLIEYPFGGRYKKEGILSHASANYIAEACDCLVGTNVAVKYLAGGGNRRSAHAELSIMVQLNAQRSNDSRSAHVVQLLDVFWDSFEKVHLVMPKLNPLPRIITPEQLQNWIPHLLKVGFLFFSLFSSFSFPFPPFPFLIFISFHFEGIVLHSQQPYRSHGHQTR